MGLILQWDALGAKFFDRYPKKQAFNPNYVSFYADTDIGDYAKKLGLFHFGTDCGIIHHHPIAKNEVADSTHWIIRGKDKEVDIQINKIRNKHGLLYPENLENIDRKPFYA